MITRQEFLESFLEACEGGTTRLDDGSYLSRTLQGPFGLDKYSLAEWERAIAEMEDIGFDPKFLIYGAVVFQWREE